MVTKNTPKMILKVRVQMSLKIVKFYLNVFVGALSKYNESICLAEDLDHLSLAYANRSQCFLKIRMYDHCLKDIALAKESGYPINLMSKLENRQSECMKNLDSDFIPHSSEPVLSIEPHERLIEMASALEIGTDDQYGRMVKTKYDLNIGETLVVEESYIRTINDEGSNECINCGKRKNNFIPCVNCADAMYCSKQCAENRFHDDECDIEFGTMESNDWLAFTLRSLIIGVNTFENIQEMMIFVESCLTNDPREVIQSCVTPKEKYRAFFKLASSNTSRQISSDFLKIAYFVFHAIMSSKKLANKFRTSAERRFLAHLIIHHYAVLRKNSFGYVKDTAVVLELSLITSCFNHSCLPNVAKLTKGNVSVCKSILPIKRNEQLFLTYIADEVFRMTEKQRNDQLAEFYDFRCTCKLCKSGTLQAHRLDSDPSFMYVVDNIKRNDFDVNIIRTIIQHCIQFLVEHADMVGSQEVHYIADILTAMYSKELNG